MPGVFFPSFQRWRFCWCAGWTGNKQVRCQGGWLLWPLIPSAVVALSLVMADCQLANSGRTAAEQIAAKYKSAGHQMWFEGHDSFQYYMEKLGGKPIDESDYCFNRGTLWLCRNSALEFCFRNPAWGGLSV